MTCDIPGCSVESTIFLACHSSGVIDCIWPCLYFVMSDFACSRPSLDVSNVLFAWSMAVLEGGFEERVIETIAGAHSTDPPRSNKRQTTTVSHLGSAMFAECLTRPQYVVRSNCDAGRSLLPGRDADILMSEESSAEAATHNLEAVLSIGICVAFRRVILCDD